MSTEQVDVINGDDEEDCEWIFVWKINEEENW